MPPQLVIASAGSRLEELQPLLENFSRRQFTVIITCKVQGFASMKNSSESRLGIIRLNLTCNLITVMQVGQMKRLLNGYMASFGQAGVEALNKAYRGVTVTAMKKSKELEKSTSDRPLQKSIVSMLPLLTKNHWSKPKLKDSLAKPLTQNHTVCNRVKGLKTFYNF